MGNAGFRRQPDGLGASALASEGWLCGCGHGFHVTSIDQHCPTEQFLDDWPFGLHNNSSKVEVEDDLLMPRSARVPGELCDRYGRTIYYVLRIP